MKHGETVTGSDFLKPQRKLSQLFGIANKAAHDDHRRTFMSAALVEVATEFSHNIHRLVQIEIFST
jgi:hypothetical protein